MENTASPHGQYNDVAVRARTFGAAQSHGEGAVALVQLPEAGAARMVSDHRQLLQDQSLVGEREVWASPALALLITNVQFKEM